MERKEIEQRYINIIKSFRKKITDKEQQKYVIKEIEKDVNAYETIDVMNKKNLGFAVLLGLAFIAVGIDIGANEFSELWKEVAIKISGLGFDLIGIYAIIKGLLYYKNDRKSLDEFAMESIEDFETMLSEENNNVRTK